MFCFRSARLPARQARLSAVSVFVAPGFSPASFFATFPPSVRLTSKPNLAAFVPEVVIDIIS
jgi:hypothetical protein